MVQDVRNESTIDYATLSAGIARKTCKQPTMEVDLRHPQIRHDPQDICKEHQRVLKGAIGREVLAFRRKQKYSVAELANISKRSTSLLSKIENGKKLPSLRTLQILAHALGVPLTAFFRGFEECRTAVHTKAGEGVDVERAGTRAGHQYNLLGHIGSNASGVVVEPYLITLSEQTDVFPIFQHEGIEMLYVLEGEVDYRHGDNLYTLKPGDTLFFDADAPHGPEGLLKLPIRYLSIITYPQAN